MSKLLRQLFARITGWALVQRPVPGMPICPICCGGRVDLDESGWTWDTERKQFVHHICLVNE